MTETSQTTDHAGTAKRFLEGGFRLSLAAQIILGNGLVIAAICFVVLSHMMSSQKMVEAQDLTFESSSRISQSVTEVTRAVRALASVHAAVEDSGMERRNAIAGTVRKTLSADGMFTHVIWATEGRVVHDSGVAVKDLPSYRDLFREFYHLDYNDVGLWRRLPWAALRGKDASLPETQPIGFAVKQLLADGKVGILFAVTTPARIFGQSWDTHINGVLRISMRDIETGDMIMDTAMGGASSGASSGIVRVEKRLDIGEKQWLLSYDVAPTGMARVLSVSYWLVLVFVLMSSLLMAALAERRHRQDKRIAEMSQSLKGAHHALQTKTAERDNLFHALRKSEREYRAVINSVSDVIFETDETGQLTFLNETWKRVTNTDTAEYLGRIFFDLLPAEDKIKQQGMFDELVRGERQAYRVETFLDLGHSSPRAVEVAFSMLRMTEDKTIRVVGTVTDTEKRRRAEMALREAEQRFRAMFENAISGIYQTSPEGRFISANPALAEMLGYNSTDEMVLSVNDIAQDVYVNPQDRKAFIQKLLFEGRVSGIEAEMKRKDGTHIWIMENARLVRAPSGSAQYFEGSIWDVTERKAAEEAMKQARLEAELSSRSRMEFLANMSHELRTPLNAVIGFSEIIKGEVMGPVGTPAYKEYAKDIYESGNYLLKIISEILEVSKIETGNRELNQRNFAIEKAMHACMTILSVRIDEAGLDVHLDIPEDLPEILAEELGFKQIMLNLIGNAIKFTDKGGRIDISAAVDDHTGEMVVSVKDTGIGMTEEQIRRAMEPFGKVDNNFSTMKAGTGLGLTIVDSLVKLHGGQFILQSKVGEGTAAMIYLPAFRVLKKSNVTPFKTFSEGA